MLDHMLEALDLLRKCIRNEDSFELGLSAINHIYFIEVLLCGFGDAMVIDCETCEFHIFFIIVFGRD